MGLQAPELKDMVHAMCTEPKTGAGRAVITDDFGSRVLGLMDGRRRLGEIAREAASERDPANLRRVCAICDVLCREGFTVDASRADVPDAYQVGLFSTEPATRY